MSPADQPAGDKCYTLLEPYRCNIGVDIVEKPSVSIFFSVDFIHAITLPSLYLQIHHLHSYVKLHQSKYILAVKLTAAA